MAASIIGFSLAISFRSRAAVARVASKHYASTAVPGTSAAKVEVPIAAWISAHATPAGASYATPFGDQLALPPAV